MGIILAASIFFKMVCWVVAIFGFFTYLGNTSSFFVVAVVVCVLDLDLACYYYVVGGGAGWLVSAILD